MKSITAILFCLASLLFLVSEAHFNFCDLNDPVTAANNAYYLSTIAAGSGNLWQHDVQVITPSTSQLPPAKDVLTYSFWQHNYINPARCAVSAIELSLRIKTTGELAVAIQEIDAKLIKPCRAKCPAIDFSSSSSSSDDDDDNSDSSNSHSHHWWGKKVRVNCERSRPFLWVTPPNADSLFVQGKVPDNTIFGDNIQVTAWRDPNTNQIALVESLYTVVPGVHRLYSLSVPVEFVPGVPASTDYGALITFNSNSAAPPPFIAAALAAYQAGTVPIETDPNSPPGFPVPVYLYTVPSSKRDESDLSAYHKMAEARASFSL